MASSMTREMLEFQPFLQPIGLARLGYDGLKDLQMEVILSFVMGQDVFAIMSWSFSHQKCCWRRSGGRSSTANIT